MKGKDHTNADSPPKKQRNGAETCKPCAERAPRSAEKSEIGKTATSVPSPAPARSPKPNTAASHASGTAESLAELLSNMLVKLLNVGALSEEQAELLVKLSHFSKDAPSNPAEGQRGGERPPVGQSF